MRKLRKKRALVPIMIAILIVMCCPVDANACVLFYTGGATTEDGANTFMRTEEIYADDNKVYYIAPEGKHKEGEVYQGCTDFKWTFTHDSYKYEARCDGKVDGMCLNCESKHDHTPYEEAGTNSKGLTVSATQSLNANAAIKKADPFTDEGIEESEMATVLLSEAKSARDGVELLTSIYEDVGAAYEGAGVMICDKDEQWYVENLSGHEYIAVLLPADVTFLQCNVSVLGRIDLDDTDHVIASEHLIDVAKKAGTFVGDEEENIIDFRASYNDYMMEIIDEDWPEEWRTHVQERLVAGLNFLEGKSAEDEDAWTVDNVLKDNHFVMTNLDEDGKITGLHNDLELKDQMTFDNILALFREYPIAFEENINTHMYRFYPAEEKELGTVEWCAMDNTMYNVFVPSYPMLLTDTWEGYQVELDEVEVTTKEPSEGDYYVKDGEYHVFPEGWDKSYMMTLNAMTNTLTYGDLSEKQIKLAEFNLQALQTEFVAQFEALQKEIHKAKSTKAREEIMTNADKEMAAQVQGLALALYKYYTTGEKSDLIQSNNSFPVVPVVIITLILLIAIILIARRLRKHHKA